MLTLQKLANCRSSKQRLTSSQLSLSRSINVLKCTTNVIDSSVVDWSRPKASGIHRRHGTLKRDMRITSSKVKCRRCLLEDKSRVSLASAIGSNLEVGIARNGRTYFLRLRYHIRSAVSTPPTRNQAQSRTGQLLGNHPPPTKV